MAIKTLSGKTTKTEIARLLGVSEGAMRYHVSRMKAEAVDGRSRQLFKAQKLAEAIEHWRGQQQGPLNLSLLYQWLRTEKDYDGSLRSVQRFWKRTYPAPAIRARRRVETPAGAQAQVDWAHFPGVVIGGERTDLLALLMVLSWSRKQAIVWAKSKDMLSWLTCHSACLTRLGGVPATLRMVAVHARRTAELLVIEQAHYDGPGTDRVTAPPPLGRMGARNQELASTAVAYRSIDLYAALAEVAR